MIDDVTTSAEESHGVPCSVSATQQDWPWTLFSVEHVGLALVITPTINGGIFRYAQLIAEADALRRKLEQTAIGGLIIDLHALSYMGSEVIGSIVALARKAEDVGGRAVFCCASPRLAEILTSMRLQRLWPLFSTREEALRAIPCDF